MQLEVQEVEIQELVFSEGILQFTKLNENKGHRKEERERGGGSQEGTSAGSFLIMAIIHVSLRKFRK